jgi:hypothetical protein
VICTRNILFSQKKQQQKQEQQHQEQFTTDAAANVPPHNVAPNPAHRHIKQLTSIASPDITTTTGRTYNTDQ